MMPHNIQQDSWKQLAGETAAKLVEDGMIIGVGSGSTAAHFIYALARRISAGLRIAGAVPSSEASAQLAGNLGIPLTNLDTYPALDLAIDGADEIDSRLRLIKGGGGALLREKIVASAARRFVVIADATKQVRQLGLKMPLPVEVISFAATPVRKRLEALGASVQLRQLAGQEFITDNGNVILDCTFPGGITDPAGLDTSIHAIVGVVETGLFLNMTTQAIIGGPEGITYVP
jgi:ribose 5-phosphate isomerase A